MLRRHFHCFKMPDEVQVGKMLALATNGSAPSASWVSQSLMKVFLGPLQFLQCRCRQQAKKIALEAPSTSNRVDASAENLYLIKLGSLQGAVSAFSCCVSPLAITEDRKNRRGLVSNLSISWSSAFTDSYSQKDLEVSSKSVLATRAIGKGRTALETFVAWWHVTSYHKASLSFA